jgi:hypothetical protein
MRYNWIVFMDLHLSIWAGFLCQCKALTVVPQFDFVKHTVPHTQTRSFLQLLRSIDVHLRTREFVGGSDYVQSSIAARSITLLRQHLES